MGNELVETIKTGQEGEIIQIRPIGSIRDISLVPCILEVFTECFNQGLYSLILDLSKIENFTPALIALVFEVTAKTRRNGGDVEIINLNSSLRQSLLRFNPFDYLTVNEEPQPDDELSSIDSPKLSEDIRAPKPEEKWQEIHSLEPPKKKASEQIRIPSRVESIYKACDFVTTHAATVGIPSTEITKMKIAIYEACLNVIEHAYRSDPNQWITVSVDYGDEKFTTMILDNGEGFEGRASDSYDIIAAASQRKKGGMGLHIIRRAMDKVSYDSDPLSGNRLVLVKNIHSTSAENISEKVQHFG